MAPYRPHYHNALLIVLALFGFGFSLSKSAGNVLIVSLYLAFLVLALRYRDFGKKVISNSNQPLLLPFLIFIGVALFGVLFTSVPIKGFKIVNKMLSLVLMYYVISVLIEVGSDREGRKQRAELLLLSFLAGIMVLNVIALMTYVGIVGHEKFVLPLAPLNVHHIWFSNLNAIGIYAAAAFLLYAERGKTTGGKAFFISSILVAMLCVLLSQSRTAWFGILLTMLIMTYVMLKSKKAIIAVVLIAFAAAALLYEFNQIVHDRIDLIITDISYFASGTTETSLGGRFLMWKAAFEMFMTNPFVGVGTGDFVPTMEAYVRSGQYPEFMLQFNQPHNIYFFALATNGIMGLGALMYIFYRGLRFSLPATKVTGPERFFAVLAVATIVHYMIAGLADTFFHIQVLRHTFAFIMGLCIRASLRPAH